MKQPLMKLTIAAALAAGMAMAQTATTPAQPEQPGAVGNHAARRQAMRHRMMQELNLTDSQKQQAKAIFHETRQSVKPIVDELKQNREALSVAIKSDDVAKIQSLAGKQGSLRGRLVSARAEGMAKFYALLTPEQRTKADQMHAKMRQRWEQRRGELKG